MFSAPASCPSADWVLSRVSRHLSRPVAISDSAALAVDVVVEADDQGVLRARLVLESPAGRRERALRDSDCVLIADAVAFIVARAIDPAVQPDAVPLSDAERASAAAGSAEAGSTTDIPAERAAELSAPSAEAAQPSPAATESAPDPADAAATSSPELIQLPPDPTPRPPPSRPLHIGWSLGAQAALAYQPLPVLAPGVIVHGALRLDDFARIALSLGYFPAHARALPSDPSVAARFDLAQAALSVCALATAASSELGLCLGARAGVVRGDGAELSEGQDHALPSLALSLGPLLVQRLGRHAALWFAFAPCLGVVRPRFTVEPGAAIYAAQLLGFSAELGAELRFD